MRYLLIIAIAFLVFSCQEGPHPVEKNIFSSRVFHAFAADHGLPQPQNAPEALAINEEYIADLRRSNNPKRAQKYYLGSDLTPSYREFLEQYVPPFKDGDFFHYLRTSFEALQHLKKTKTTFSDDASSEGNLPFLQFTLPNGTKVIRMGLPMVEQLYLQSLLFPPSFNPEFLLFLRSVNRHLYVNLMKREGLEAPYTHALEASKEPALKVVTLDKNTDFYWQNGNYPDSSSAFKELFYQKMRDPEGAYFLPKELDLVAAIEAVDRQYFGKETLNVEERKAFIELTYLEILDRLVELWQPDSLNITCKHAIDRGPSLAVLWQLKLNLADPETATALLLVPPLLIHNRAPHEARIERFISTSNFFYPKKKGEARIQ